MIMSGYDFLNSQVLSCWQKVESVCDVVISSGRLFQTRGPATVNARSPTVERLTDGTIRRLVPQSVMSVGRADRQQQQVVPDTAAHFRVKLCTLERRPCTVNINMLKNKSITSLVPSTQRASTSTSIPVLSRDDHHKYQSINQSIMDWIKLILQKPTRWNMPLQSTWTTLMLTNN